MSFPSSPTNGQRTVINGITYQYSSATNSWKRSPTTTVTTLASATPPTNPVAGAQWYNTANDKLYFYINDGTSSYWVDMSGIIFNVSSTTAVAGIKITTVATAAGATAANLDGGETFTISGSGFNTGITAYVNTTPLSVTYVNSTALTFTTTSQSASTNNLILYNTDGSSGVKPLGIIYAAYPAWTTAAGALGQGSIGYSYNQTLSATGTGITYSITSGSLPVGLALNSSTGVISGTVAGAASTYNFTVSALDSYNRSVSRSFSITTVSGTFVEYLVVAGGGGGGFDVGGGGGAGGLLFGNVVLSLSTAITVTVGAGGSGSNTLSTAAPSGGNSVISASGMSTVTAIGGGGGGSWTGNVGLNGGSGGGSTSNTSTAGLGTAGQGYNGGTPSNNTANSYEYAGASGGGGADQAGGNGSTSAFGALSTTYAYGGRGKSNTQLSGFLAATTSGVDVGGVRYIAGGGGGSSDNGSNTGAGGYGGGGNGNSYSATVNTGGGGGGAGNPGTGGSGGSGIVIVRAASAASATTGSPTVVNTGGYYYYKFTTSGTVTF